MRICCAIYDMISNQPHRQLSLLRPAEQCTTISIWATRKFYSFGNEKCDIERMYTWKFREGVWSRGEEKGLFLNNIDFMVLVLDSTQSLNSKLQSMWMNKIDSSHSFPLYFELDIFQLNRPRKQHSTVMTTNFHSFAFFNPQIYTNCIAFMMLYLEEKVHDVWYVDAIHCTFSSWKFIRSQYVFSLSILKLQFHFHNFCP
jgi:hypothetical protein